MVGLFKRDYLQLTQEEENERKRIDSEGRNVSGAPFGRKNMFHKYPKAVRHNMTLFPNNYLDTLELKEVDKLEEQCNGFEEVLENKNTTELDIKRYIQNNGFYHIPASIFKAFNFGHHEAVLFKEFQLGTSYKADYLLVGRASGGWQFIWVEFENPYNNIARVDGTFGETIRKGINQIDEWKRFLESNYATVSAEFEKATNKPLPNEFVRYDSTRMHYVVIAGRRNDFSNDLRTNQRCLYVEKRISLFHYDNLLDFARGLINCKTY